MEDTILTDEQKLQVYSNLVKACKYLEQLIQLELRGGTPSKQRLDKITKFINEINE